MVFDYRHVLLHLQLIPGIGPAVIEKLVQHLSADKILDKILDFYEYTAHDFMNTGVISLHKAELLVKGLADKELLKQELALLSRYGIQWTTVFDTDYPALLKSIYLPPVILYWKGAHPAHFDKTLAVVGARTATAYAETCVRLLASDAIMQGICIVSGGALGADTYAHERALALKCPTIAVLGSGLLKPYPAQNKNLFTRIVENGGAVLSSFPLTTAPQSANFPARNRIIAGLSRGCLVLQAAVKSGALITARYALDQGREVGVVPGSIEEPLSAGCHLLLSQGAHCITQSQEVLEVLCHVKASDRANKQVDMPSIILPTKDPKDSIDSTKVQIGVDPIVHFCKEPRSFDELLSAYAYEPALLYDKLFELQLSGDITQNIVGLWCATERA